MPGYNTSDEYNQLLAAILMGGGQNSPYQAGKPSAAGMSGAGASGDMSSMPPPPGMQGTGPVSQGGQSFVTNNMGGMLANAAPSPYQTINPMAPAGAQGPPNPLQGYDPFTLQQGMEAYPQMRGMPGGVWDGGGGGAEG